MAGKVRGGGLQHGSFSEWDEVLVVGQQRGSGTRASGKGADLHLGVPEQQPEQLTAGVSGGAGYRDLDRHVIIMPHLEWIFQPLTT